MPQPVVLPGAEPGAVASALGDLTAAEGVDAALRQTEPLGVALPRPGTGGTALLWSALASLGAHDLAVARAIEPHLDAIAVLGEAGRPAAAGTWGVYAAERPGTWLSAEPDGTGFRLTGVKPWCSLADRLDRALVTAHVDGGRRLFSIDLHDHGVAVAADEWHALGMAAIPSSSIRLDGVAAEPVGEAGWYLERPGFAWGGIGVAACWFGGATAIGRALLDAARRREPDQIAQAAVGRVDRLLHGAREALGSAARAVDDGAATDAAGALLAARVRGVVADAAEQVLQIVGHALGPAPLTLDAVHAQRVADLTVYLRQHHAERDDADLGRRVLAAGPRPW